MKCIRCGYPFPKHDLAIKREETGFCLRCLETMYLHLEIVHRDTMLALESKRRYDNRTATGV